MSKAHDKQIRFVLKVLALKLTDDVKLAAIWFRNTKSWRISQTDAIDNFKKWLPQ